MAFQVSPGVSVAEVDLTTRVPIPSISDGGYSGRFKWGPIHDVELVSSEDDLVDKFGKPDGTIFAGYIPAANFLSYSNKLRVVRTANTSQAKNAVANGSAVLIQNDAKYSNTYESVTTSGTNWAAKWAGDLGNTFKTSICMATRANTEVSSDGVVTVASTSYVTMNGTFAMSGTTVTATTAADGDVANELRIGDIVTIAESSTSNIAVVTAVANSSEFTAVATGSGSDTGLLAGTGSAKTIRRLKRSAFEEPAENMLGTIQVSLGANTITGTNTKFQTQINLGDIVICTDAAGQTQRRRVTAVTSNTALSVDSAYSTSAVSASTTYSREWEFRADFDTEPLTSTYAYDRTSKKDVNDEIHIIVVDEDGEWTGTKDKRGATRNQTKSVLEAHPTLSVANGATGSTGETIYYKDYINQNSRYIRWMDHSGEGDANTVNSVQLSQAWGATISSSNTSANNSFEGSFGAIAAANGIVTESFSGGNDGASTGDADIIKGFAELRDPQKVDVSLLISGEVSNTVATYLIQDIAEFRKDCVAFISPENADVVNKTGSEVDNIVARRNVLPSSSYGIMDGNYKYQLDRFTGVFRYVPLNGDIAGLCAQTDNINPFISPAGFNRGNVKNVTKLAFSPQGAERDDLYLKGINPVVSFPGQGTVLFGDKTLLAKPSSFDRINVRRLFIAIEKAIANAAQFSLFEFNDDFTRAQFRSMVEPFLRDVQSRRGIVDFKVVCDATNNTPTVIDRNEFRGDIFIKPNRSINFINLNFVAVASGVEFSEVVNAV